jgi:uncharacterized protein (DUF2141 family)
MKNPFWTFLLVFCALVLGQEKQKEKGILVVNIDGLPNNKGKVMIALDNTKESFSSNGNSAYKGANAVIKEKKASVTFNALPYGLYAVKVFHDENNNDELDSNIMGIPREAYGFSNNARGTFGPASWDDACFEITNDSLVISITLE